MRQTHVLVLIASLTVLGAIYSVYLKTAGKHLIIPPIEKESAQSSTIKDESGISMSYFTNIVKATQDNEYFRRVLFTGPKSQLVLMSIPPGGEVGEETHKYTEQTLFSFQE
jgi:quercetin dioxygenase-like cupin family protein